MTLHSWACSYTSYGLFHKTGITLGGMDYEPLAQDQVIQALSEEKRRTDKGVSRLASVAFDGPFSPFEFMFRRNLAVLTCFTPSYETQHFHRAVAGRPRQLAGRQFKRSPREAAASRMDGQVA